MPDPLDDHNNSRTQKQTEKIGGVLIPFSIIDDNALSGADKLIYSYLLAFQMNGKYCFQANATLAERLNLGESTVKRSLSEMLKAEYIKRIKWENKIAFQCVIKKKDQIDPKGSKRSTNGIKMIQNRDQIDTYKNNFKKNSNNTNLTTQQRTALETLKIIQAEEANETK